MKVKDIKVGIYYADKNKNSIRKVVSIEGNNLKYILIDGRYKSDIGSISSWEIKRFARWAKLICNESDKSCYNNGKNISDDNNDNFIHEKYKVRMRVSLKNQFTLEDIYKMDGMDENLSNEGFKISDFKKCLIDYLNEYEVCVICKHYIFPFNYEEMDKYWDIV